ncbi:MAG: HAD-IIIA family hydrolase [Candidatus Taylorbacteria bacterium]|nr:HAD-IIIA family hydrolase [Candidatus Taylorbacteria bacterium]
MTNKRKAVFFDRDGVILKMLCKKGRMEAPQSIAEFREQSGIIPGANEAIQTARDRGFLAILATNQPDIHYGEITQEDFDSIQAEVAKLPFDDIFICFHGREEGCDCKKPKPGLLLQAAKKWDIDLSKSCMLGDTEYDTGAATSAGCKSILLSTSYNTSLGADYRIASLTDPRFGQILDGLV